MGIHVTLYFFNVAAGQNMAWYFYVTFKEHEEIRHLLLTIKIKVKIGTKRMEYHIYIIVIVFSRFTSWEADNSSPAYAVGYWIDTKAINRVTVITLYAVRIYIRTSGL
jgi:hypothetical protein